MKLSTISWFLFALLSLPLQSCTPNPDEVYFAAIGDFGKNNADESNVSQLIRNNKVDFIITLGDNNYPNGCADTIDNNIGKYFHDYIGNYKGTFGQGAVDNKFFPSLGNHDWDALLNCLEEGQIPYFNYFDLPGNERYYDFVKGPIHFFSLDSDGREPDGNGAGSTQYQWFTQQVSISKSPFKVVFFHHPPYSSAAHGSHPVMQWNFSELGIDLVITGHDHSYERIHKDGVVYIVNGLGGASPYNINTPIQGSQIFYNQKHGASFIRANATEMTVQFKDTDNTLIDALTLHSRHKLLQ